MTSILSILIAILASCFSQQSQDEKPEAPVITIRRTGGYMGTEDQVSLFADGKVIDAKGKVRHVRPAVMEDFIRSIGKIHAAMPDKACLFQNLCFDCFRYSISISRNSIAEKFYIVEPIPVPAEKGVDDARAFREFLSDIFSQSDRE